MQVVFLYIKNINLNNLSSGDMWQLNARVGSQCTATPWTDEYNTHSNLQFTQFIYSF